MNVARKIGIIAAIYLLWAGCSLAAQGSDTVNIYRYILTLDVPESAGLIALQQSPLAVVRGSAPKPLMASVFSSSGIRHGGTGIAIDASPYFLAGGGVRSLARHRNMSVGGRLTRVLIKTTLSLAAVRTSNTSAFAPVAAGLRMTFHDPHDPALNSRLPEQLESTLDSTGLRKTARTDESVVGEGTDELFAESRAVMRSRTGNQVSGGWGVSGQLKGSSLSADSLETIRHSLWLSSQWTFNSKFDLLTTLRLNNVFRSDATLLVGSGIQRKSFGLEMIGAVHYDAADKHLHPGVSIEGRPLPRCGIVLSMSSAASHSPSTSSAEFHVRLMARYHFSAD